MIGQKNNLRLLELYKEEGKFPQFVVITGEEGSGRYTLAKHIIKNILDIQYILPGNSADNVREVIEEASKCAIPTAYIFLNADRMSTQAKNSLLKLTEEPPKSAYFIMTVEDKSRLLYTLQSRAVEFKMAPYSREELLAINSDEKYIKLARTPGQIKYLEQINIDEFRAFCEKVLDNIGLVTGVNALKMAINFKFKEEDTGYDVIAFLDALMMIIAERISGSEQYKDTRIALNKLLDICLLCSKYKSDFKINGIRKDSLFDLWIMDVREVMKR